MPSVANASPILRLHDPDLPLLAAQAAIELDAARRGKFIGFSTAKEIAHRLRSSLDQSEDNGSKAVLDSNAFAIMARAVDSTEWAGRVKNDDQLIDETTEIADAMDQLTENASTELIEKIRNFCVELSKSAAAYRQSLHDLEPSHPFRR
jgi:chemotaxis protein histidine kinase CheA